MNWEKRLEDARARRQVVLEQKDRAARAAKAAAQSTPEAAKTPKNSGEVKSIPRARPAGSHARAVEAALRKRDVVQQRNQSQEDTFEFRANENVAPEVKETRKSGLEGVPPVPEQVTIANAVAAPSRGSRPGLRILLVASAITVSFGIGIIVGPTIVTGVQQLASLPQTPFAAQDAPQQLVAAQVADGQSPSLVNVAGDETLGAARRNSPLPPELVAHQPALPLISLPPFGFNEVGSVALATPQISVAEKLDTVGSVLIAAPRPAPRRAEPIALDIQDGTPLSLAATIGPSAPLLMRQTAQEVSNFQVAALPLARDDGVLADKSALIAVAFDSAPVALLSPGPQLISAPDTQALALPRNSDELPTLPLQSIAPNRPDSGPATLIPLFGERGVAAGSSAPPVTDEKSPRLTGIGDLRSYLVHLQSPRSLSNRQLAGFESAIRDAGLPIGKVNRVGYKISASHVRYYHRRDAVAAAALAERINARSRDFTNYRPSPPFGTLEVFLSKSASSRLAATQGATEPSQQDRELIELRDRLIQALRRGDHL